MALFGAALFGSVPTPAQADALKVYRSQGDGGSISGLDMDEPQIKVDNSGGKKQKFVIITGTYSRGASGWTLSIGKVQLRLDSNGGFKAKTRYVAGRKTLAFTATGPDGNEEKEQIAVLTGGEADQEEQRTHEDANSQNWITLEAGGSSLSYSQNAAAGSPAVSYHQKSLDVAGNYRIMLSAPSWSLDLGGSATGAAFSVDLAGYTVRIISLDGSVAYHGRLGHFLYTELSGGIFYKTMSVSPNTFGFTNLSGVTLGVLAGHRLADQSTISARLVYAPVSTGGFLLSNLSGSEVVLGVEYAMHLDNGDFIPIFLNYTNINTSLFSSTASTTTAIPLTLSFITFGAGYRF